MKKTSRLQELFQREQIFVIAGGGCALHAKMVEAFGFKVLLGAHASSFPVSVMSSSVPSLNTTVLL